MKKRCRALFAVLAYSALRLYGLEGSAAVSSDKDIKDRAAALSESAAQHYPLNSKLVIINPKTGIGAEITVLKRLSGADTGVVAEVSQYIADTLGFQGKSGAVILLDMAGLTQGIVQEVKEVKEEPPAPPPSFTQALPAGPAVSGTPQAYAPGEIPARAGAVTINEKPLAPAALPPDAVLSLVPAEERPPPQRPLSELPADAEVAPLIRKPALAEEPAPLTRKPALADAEAAPLARSAPAGGPAGIPPEAEAAPLARSAPAAPAIPRLSSEPGAPAGNSLPSIGVMPEITLPAEAPVMTKPPEAPRNPGPPASARPLAGLPPAITAPPAQRSPPVRSALPPEAEIPPIETASVMSGPTAPPVQGRGPAGAAARPFSAPQITRLEKGKYYLQLAAFSKAELVEPELARIGKAYPLVIETAERQAKPLYRILVGPVSPGESGALLNRFKKIGYADAFIRPGV